MQSPTLRLSYSIPNDAKHNANLERGLGQSLNVQQPETNLNHDRLSITIPFRIKISPLNPTYSRKTNTKNKLFENSTISLILKLVKAMHDWKGSGTYFKTNWPRLVQLLADWQVLVRVWRHSRDAIIVNCEKSIRDGNCNQVMLYR